jgi:hypothetical protein
MSMASQLDLFNQPPPELSKAHPATDVGATWRERMNADGPPEYRAAKEMLHFIDYLKLNTWQQKTLWPHLKAVAESLHGVTNPDRLRFELGYVVGSLEVEQLRTRSEALKIAEVYGVTF